MYVYVPATTFPFSGISISLVRIVFCTARARPLILPWQRTWDKRKLVDSKTKEFALAFTIPSAGYTESESTSIPSYEFPFETSVSSVLIMVHPMTPFMPLLRCYFIFLSLQIAFVV